MPHNLRPLFAALLSVLLLSPLLALDSTSSGSCTIQPFVAGLQGASPQESPMLRRNAVLRLVVRRKPVAFCAHPQREDALNFLKAYAIETLECGHEVHVFFNPPVENLIAKRRRCQECDEREKVIEITAGKKKPPVSVGIPAADRKRVLL